MWGAAVSCARFPPGLRWPPPLPPGAPPRTLPLAVARSPVWAVSLAHTLHLIAICAHGRHASPCLAAPAAAGSLPFQQAAVDFLRRLSVPSDRLPLIFFFLLLQLCAHWTDTSWMVLFGEQDNSDVKSLGVTAGSTRGKRGEWCLMLLPACRGEPYCVFLGRAASVYGVPAATGPPAGRHGATRSHAAAGRRRGNTAWTGCLS